MANFSGPMFMDAETEYLKSVHNADGAHYNNYAVKAGKGMVLLRETFQNGGPTEDAFVLFSTSGIHGTYSKIEDFVLGADPRDEDTPSDITFLIVYPRICCLIHGNCVPQTKGDIEFLKKLRQASWNVVPTIGAPL